jgi:hypothetical protein
VCATGQPKGAVLIWLLLLFGNGPSIFFLSFFEVEREIFTMNASVCGFLVVECFFPGEMHWILFY